MNVIYQGKEFELLETIGSVCLLKDETETLVVSSADVSSKPEKKRAKKED